MKRLITSLLIASAVAGTALAQGYTNASDKDVFYSYTDVVDMVTDMQQLALLPPNGEKGAAETSYDRSSKYDEETDTYIDWADYEVSNFNGSRPYTSNADGWGYISKVNDEKGEGILAADIKGTGAIFRSWFATVGEGNIEIYIDGSEEPTICMPTKDFVDSSNASSPYYGLDNMAYTIAEGKNNYVPITFNESCKIILRDGWGDYYQFSYRLFADGVTVEPTTGASFTAEQKQALSDCNAILDNCGEAPATYNGETTSTGDYKIAPGKSATLFQASGEGAITRFKLKFNKALGNDCEKAMQKLELSMYWDGEENPSVWTPLGDFFATPGGQPYKSLPLGLEDDGTFYCYWYMPYSDGAKIVLENLNDKECDIHVEVTTAPLEHSVDSYARFHAKWSTNRFLPEREDRGSDYTVLKVEGSGRFLGFNLHLYMITGGYWWGEGDEKFFVDGEKFPSTFGTGSEDYFGYAWGSGAYFTHAFHSQNWITGIFAENSNINNVRFQIGDNVPFQTEFEASIEKFFDDDNDRYYATAFFYLDKDGVDPYTPVKYADGEEADFRFIGLNPETEKYGTLLYRNDFERYENAANDQSTWGNATFAHHSLNETRLSSEDSVVAYTLDPVNAKNHALQITQSSNPYTRATLYFSESSANAISKYGEYTLLGDVYIPENIGDTQIGPLAFIYSDESGHSGANKSTVWASAGNAGAWKRNNELKFAILDTQDLNLGTAENFNWGADGDGLKHIYFANMASPTENTAFYIDNLRLYYMPTARVKYDLGDLSSFLPNQKTYVYHKAGEELCDLTKAFADIGYEFLGWSKTKDGSVLSDYTVTLDDINAGNVTFYAVAKKKSGVFYTVEADKTVISGVDGTATITASESTDWTYDLGTTEAVVSTTDTTFKITSVGYAGEIKVTANSKVNKNQTKSITVKLLGATKWKPGVDVLSGTANTLDFDTMTDEQLRLAFANNWANAYGLVADPINADNKVIGLLQNVSYKNWVTIYWANRLTTPIEIERPIKITFDYCGKTTDNWVSVGDSVGNVENDAYVNLGSLNSESMQWKRYSGTPVLSDKLISAHQDGITTMAFENGGDIDGINEYYIDNISFIPYYRIEIRTFDGQTVDVVYTLPSDGVFAPGESYLASIGIDGFYTEINGEKLTEVSLENRDLVLLVDNTAKTYDDTSIRLGETFGIRFKAGITDLKASNASECGFIIARKSVLDSIGKDLTFALDQNSADGTKQIYVSCVAYKEDGTVDETYESDNVAYFSGVLVNFPESAYGEQLTCRSYVKYTVAGKTVTLYGKSVSRSLIDVAKDAKNENDEYYNQHKDEIDNIIAKE